MRSNEIEISIGSVATSSKNDGSPSKMLKLRGNLNLPNGATSLVIFSHGSGSSRFSPRNNFVAGVLNEQKIATLLTDLLTEQEDSIYENRFNIELLTERLLAVTDFIHFFGMQSFSIGYFGASTGAASALRASEKIESKFSKEQLNYNISAVVSRGGRPDLAGSILFHIKAPVLLIVGSLDEQVIELNRAAFAQLTHSKNKELLIIPGATHLFEESGTLEEVAESAANWFNKYLAVTTHTGPVRSVHVSGSEGAQ